VDKSVFEYKRKSYIQKGEIYFWTATINKWQYLLQADVFKDVIVSSLEYLSKQEKIDVFAFVIMPNHIHVIWRIKENKGKETAQGSFLKYTTHEFRKLLMKGEGRIELSNFAVRANNKSHEFWQQDSLAIPLYTQRVAFQKLD
jgi:REP element-mobilizing transposase RayT